MGSQGLLRILNQASQVGPHLLHVTHMGQIQHRMDETLHIEVAQFVRLVQNLARLMHLASQWPQWSHVIAQLALLLSRCQTRNYLDAKLGNDQKGLHRRGIHDQGDFWKFPLETTVKNALK